MSQPQPRKRRDGLQNILSSLGGLLVGQITIFILQALASFFRLLLQREIVLPDANPALYPLCSALASLESFANENWLPLSMLLILLVASIVCYTKRKRRTSRGIANTILLALNLALLGRLFEAEGLSEKATYLGSHVASMLIFFVVVLLILFIIGH